MKLMARACVLALVTLGGVSAAFAQDQKPSKPVGKLGPRQYGTVNWGRRSDLTVKYWRLHQTPYMKIY
jgi:hypothetical protein